MRLRFSDLWRWDGTVDRGPYALVGAAGFAIKHNLDRIVAAGVFKRQWDLFNYWVPPTKAIHIGGRTRLDGTSWYRNRMWPVEYWTLWSDTIVHQVHLRVFRNIKRLAEQDSLRLSRRPQSNLHQEAVVTESSRIGQGYPVKP